MEVIMDKDIQFQIECLSTELVELLMQKYGWSIKKALTSYILPKLTNVCVIQRVAYIMRELYMFSHI